MQSIERTATPIGHTRPESELTLGLTPSDGLDFLQSRVEADDEGKWDTVANRNDLRLYDGLVSIPAGEGSVYHLTPNSWAMTQFCQRLAMPTAYFKRCPMNLQSAQFNHWIREGMPEDKEGDTNPGEPVRWLLRAKEGDLRGVLSERYAKLDNHTVLDCLRAVVSDRFEVRWSAITEESFHLRLVDPTIGREVVRDDRLIVGIHIANSEVGRRAFTIDALVHRLVCANGMIRLVKGKSLLYRRHINLVPERFQDAVRTSIGEAVATSAAFIDQLHLSTHVQIGDPEAAIVELAAEAGLSQATQERMKLALSKERPEHQEKLYGLVNAATDAAQALSPDERYDLEVVAGRMVERAFATDLSARTLRLAA
jgi:hypothetical protein